jgi:hypothetical protein
VGGGQSVLRSVRAGMGASLNRLYANEAGRWSPSLEEMRGDRRDDDGPSRGSFYAHRSGSASHRGVTPRNRYRCAATQ